MLGFGNNPDSETLQMVSRHAASAAQFCMYIYQKNAIPPKDGEEPVYLNEGSNKEKIVSVIENIISANKLDEDGATDRINALVLEEKNNPTENFYENALGLVTMINVINGICKMYYADYPKSKKLLDIVNQLAKITSPALIKVFGNYPPNSIRKSWPHISSIFEHYKANG